MTQPLQLPPMLRGALPNNRYQNENNNKNNNNSNEHKTQVIQSKVLASPYRNRNNNNDLSDSEEKKNNKSINIISSIKNLDEIAFKTIDAISPKFSTVAPYINKVLGYSWIPVVVYYGLKQGTHKYFPGDDIELPQELQDTQLDRAPSWTDLLPFVGSAGCQNSGLFAGLN